MATIMLDSAGIQALMRSDAIAAEVDRQAERLATTADRIAGRHLYGAKPHVLKETRALALTVPLGARGSLDEARHKSLSKAVSQCSL